MRIDLALSNEGPWAKEALDHAPELEAMGYGGLWLADHVVGLKSYAPVYTPIWFEALTSLGYLARATRTIRLGIGVMVTPYRDAVLTAKIIATLDVLSNGRIDLGIGTGWAAGEFRALGRGALFDDRGPVTNEALDVMLQAWAGGEQAFEGRWSNFRGVTFEPRPVQPRVPLWIGSGGPLATKMGVVGAAPAPLRRAAKYADVWHPTNLSVSELAAAADQLDDLAGRKVARSARKRYPAATDPGEIIADMQAYAQVGCFQGTVDFRAETFAEFMTAAERLALASDDVGRSGQAAP